MSKNLIETLTKRNVILTEKLNRSLNELEKAELLEKINHNNKVIAELTFSAGKKEVIESIDAPVIADSTGSNRFGSGSIIDDKGMVSIAL